MRERVSVQDRLERFTCRFPNPVPRFTTVDRDSAADRPTGGGTRHLDIVAHHRHDMVPFGFKFITERVVLRDDFFNEVPGEIGRASCRERVKTRGERGYENKKTKDEDNGKDILDEHKTKERLN